MRAVTFSTAISLYSGVVGVVSVPVIAVALGADEFGKSAYIQAFALWLSFACTFGMPYQIRHHLSSGTQRTEGDLLPFGANYLAHTAIALAAFAIASYFLGLFSPQDFLFVCAYLITHSLFTLDQSCDLGEGKFVLYARKQAEYVTVSALGAIVALYAISPIWEIRISFQIIGLMAPIVIRQENIKALIPRRPAALYPRYSLLKRSSVISAHSSVDKVYTQLDRILIQALFGDVMLGVYAFSMSIASGLNLVAKMVVAWYERGVMGAWPVAELDKRFYWIAGALLLSAGAGVALIIAIPNSWLEIELLRGFPIVPSILAGSFIYTASKMLYALVFPRFMRSQRERAILIFDGVLLLPVAASAVLVAYHTSVPWFQLFVSGAMVLVTLAALRFSSFPVKSSKG